MAQPIHEPKHISRPPLTTYVYMCWFSIIKKIAINALFRNKPGENWCIKFKKKTVVKEIPENSNNHRGTPCSKTCYYGDVIPPQVDWQFNTAPTEVSPGSGEAVNRQQILMRIRKSQRNIGGQHGETGTPVPHRHSSLIRDGADTACKQGRTSSTSRWYWDGCIYLDP